jgi:cell division protease FtsH
MTDVAGLMVLEKQRSTFLQGGTTKEYSSKMAEDVDQFIKDFLDERYKIVLETLRTYSDAIEKMVVSLYETENIDGKQVVDIIDTYEKEHNMESRLTTHENANDDIKEALKKEEDKTQKKDHKDEEEDKE